MLILKDLLALFRNLYFFHLHSPLLVSFTNAFRPDSPSHKFRGQQNYSEDSESTEGTESTEETEDPDNSEMAASGDGSLEHFT